MKNRVQKVCKECHKPFSISDGELNWLKEKGLMPFERCSACRKKRRDEKKAKENRNNGQ